MYAFLPIITDKNHPKLTERLGLSTPPFYVTRSSVNQLKDAVQANWGKVYLVIVPPANMFWLDRIARLQIPVGNESINLFCLHYVEDPYVRQAWENKGFEVASTLTQLIHWY